MNIENGIERSGLSPIVSAARKVNASHGGVVSQCDEVRFAGY